MSWWGGKQPLELVDVATSETIPSGEQNLALNLDICDMVRSKKLPADQTAKAIRRRLFHINPNVQILALHLMDLMIKNGGSHFLEQVATKDFTDAYVGQIRTMRNQGRSPEVVELMLEYFQLWANMTRHRESLGQIWRAYEQLRDTKGIEFPTPTDLSASFVDSATAPDWVDSDTCMKSGQQFSFYNRKHHCRNCGGVFVQEYCHDFLPLPQYGITEPVRVCIDCKQQLESKNARSSDARVTFRGTRSNNSDIGSAFDNDLKRALELSLKDSPPSKPSQESQVTQELDEDMKAAIAASLADMEAAKRQVQTAPGQGSAGMSRTAKSYLVKDSDFSDVEQFSSSVQIAQPHDAIYDERLVNMNKNALSLQPRLVRELTATTDKLQTLEDLQGRMMAISSYYDRLLDAELHPARGRYAIPNQPQTLSHEHTGASASVSGHNTGISHTGPQYAGPSYPPVHNGPSYAPRYSHVTPSAPSAPRAPSEPPSTGDADTNNKHIASAPASSELSSLPSAPAHVPDQPQREEEVEENEEPASEPILIEL